MQRGFNIIRMYLFIFIVIQSIFVLKMETIHFIDRHCGERPAFVAQPFGQTLQTNAATWDVIETPGHTTDHLSFTIGKQALCLQVICLSSQRQRLCLMKKTLSIPWRL